MNVIKSNLKLVLKMDMAVLQRYSNLNVFCTSLFLLLFISTSSQQGENQAVCQTEECLSARNFALYLASVFSKKVENKTVCETEECLSAAKSFKESMNLSVNPCDNFYHYACGNFPNYHPNSDPTPQSTLRIRYEENSAEIIEFLKKKNTKDEPKAVHKARKLFSSCMNKDSFSNKLEPIEKILQKIGIPVLPFIPDENRTIDYATILARASRLTGIKVHFDLGTSLNPLNRTMNIIALKKPRKIAEITYSPKSIIKEADSNESISEPDFLIKIADRLCENNNSSSCRKWISYIAGLKKAFGTMVIKSTHDSSQNFWIMRYKLNNTCDAPAIYSLKQVQEFTDQMADEIDPFMFKINWTRYIEEIFTDINNVTLNLSNTDEVKISIEDFDSFIDTMRIIYTVKRLPELEAEIWWAVVSTLVPYLDSDIFDMKSNVARSKDIPTREQRCATITTAKFNVAVSYMYTKRDKYTKFRKEIQNMIENIRKSLKKTIKQSSWMDKITKEKVLQKLRWIYYYIMYPDIVTKSSHLEDMYRDVNITDNFYDSIMSVTQDQITKELSTLNKINHLHDERNFPPITTVNAYYETSKNYILISGGLVGTSMNSNSLKAVDYGALGTVIGHELHHALDFTGRCHDHFGNYNNWWKPETWKLFKQKAQCFVEVYDGYNTTLNGVTQQGDSERTLCEDLSDNGGFKESLSAYRTLASKIESEPFLPQFENFTHEQLFTLAFANIWCENPSPAYNQPGRRSAVHSPNGVRVNGVLRNSKEFSEIWKCPEGSNMNPTDKCSLW